MMRHCMWMCGLVMLVGGWALPVMADVSKRSSSIEQIESDLREIERLLGVNQQRQEELGKQIEEAGVGLKTAEETLENARRKFGEARERLAAANSRVVSAQGKRDEIEKKLLESMQSESGWKMALMQLQGAEEQWQTERSRVLQGLAEQTEYKNLQGLLQDARQRADARLGTGDPALRMTAGETARSLESQIGKLEAQALAEDQTAEQAQKKLDERRAERDQLQKTQLEQLKQKPEYREATDELEKTRSEVAQAQKDHDQAKLEQARAETGASRARGKLQAMEGGLVKAQLEQKKLEETQTKKREDLSRARRGLQLLR